MQLTNTYEALLSDPRHVAWVRASSRDIERMGGTVRVYPPNPSGLTLVELTLPTSLQPGALFPGLPFTLI